MSFVDIKEKDYIKQIKILSCLINIKIDTNTYEIWFRVLGICVFRSKLRGSWKKYCLFGVPIWFKNVNKSFSNKFLDNVCEKYGQYDDYYVFLCRSGEFYLMMHHLKDYVKNNNSANFLLVFTSNYHLNICKMFYPHLPMAYIKKLQVPCISRNIKKKYFEYKNHKFYVPVYEKYFQDVEDGVRDKNEHYYNCLKKQIGASDSLTNLKISEESISKVKLIASYILKNNFIFISPETLSNEPMEKDFWQNLCKKLQDEGYEIFYNVMFFSNLIPKVHSAFLTYEESIELAKHAKAIVGLRSGFLECLSASNTPLHALYTDFPKRSGFKPIESAKVLTGWCIKKLPNVNPDEIYEYDANLYDEDNLIDEIVNKIKTDAREKESLGVGNG